MPTPMPTTTQGTKNSAVAASAGSRVAVVHQHLDGNVTTIHPIESKRRKKKTREISGVDVPSVGEMPSVSSPFTSASPSKDDEDDAAAVDEDDEDDDAEKQKQRENLPILIIPGFMSSGLEVKQSLVQPSLEGKRVWLNLTQLGLDSLHRGGATIIKKKNRSRLGPVNLQRLDRAAAAAAATSNRRLETGDVEMGEIEPHDNRNQQGNEDQSVDVQMESTEKYNSRDDSDEDAGDDAEDDSDDDECDDEKTPDARMKETLPTSTPVGDDNHNYNSHGDDYADLVRRQARCKSDWLQHMSLNADMMTEREGIQVRPIAGLAGVDYLTPGALTSHLSYVFGPLIRAMQQRGHTQLFAATYDWRLPPSQLERRDAYFSETMQLIDDIYQGRQQRPDPKNNKNQPTATTKKKKTPVVLVAHSLGCKACHYLLNFIRQRRGQEWIDERIYAYIPIGGPHGGAPKSIRASVQGEKFGLEAFLSDEEGLLLGRSLGSGPWLLPRALPWLSSLQLTNNRDLPPPPPTILVRREGSLRVTVLTPIRCARLFSSSGGGEEDDDEAAAAATEAGEQRPKSLRLGIQWGPHALVTTKMQKLTPTTQVLNCVGQTFLFPVSHDVVRDLLVEDDEDENYRSNKSCWLSRLFCCCCCCCRRRPRPSRRQLNLEKNAGLQVELFEPGLRRRRQRKQHDERGLGRNADSNCCNSGGCVHCSHYVICFLPRVIYFLLVLVYLLVKYVLQFLQCLLSDLPWVGAQVAAQAAGKTSRVAQSEKWYPPKLLSSDQQETMEVTLAIRPRSTTATWGLSWWWCCHDKSRQQEEREEAHVRLRIEWNPPLHPYASSISEDADKDRNKDKNNDNGLHDIDHKTSTARFVKNDKGAPSSPPSLSSSLPPYDKVKDVDLLRSEGLHQLLHLAASVYDKDELGPRDESAFDAPPVRRVHAIYGTQVPTEVGAVYRRRKAHLRKEHRIQNIYELDKEATLSSVAPQQRQEKRKHSKGNESHGLLPLWDPSLLELRGGILRETPQTPQVVYTAESFDSSSSSSPHQVKACCGDGTVPYWSLQVPRRWISSSSSSSSSNSPSSCCQQVTVDELQGAEHREILADERLHQLLLHYCSREVEDDHEVAALEAGAGDE